MPFSHALSLSVDVQNNKLVLEKTDGSVAEDGRTAGDQREAEDGRLSVSHPLTAPKNITKAGERRDSCRLSPYPNSDSESSSFTSVKIKLFQRKDMCRWSINYVVPHVFKTVLVCNPFV